MPYNYSVSNVECDLIIKNIWKMMKYTWKLSIFGAFYVLLPQIANVLCVPRGIRVIMVMAICMLSTLYMEKWQCTRYKYINILNKSREKKTNNNTEKEANHCQLLMVDWLICLHISVINYHFQENVVRASYNSNCVIQQMHGFAFGTFFPGPENPTSKSKLTLQFWKIWRAHELCTRCDKRFQNVFVFSNKQQKTCGKMRNTRAIVYSVSRTSIQL